MSFFIKFKKNKITPASILSKNGFTLLELLIVIAIVAVLAGFVFVALNPLKRFEDARNAKRYASVDALIGAVKQYEFDSGGYPPTGIDTTLRMIGTATSGCDVSCEEVVGANLPFLDNTQILFNMGTYTNTKYNGSGFVDLTAAGLLAKLGTYTSNIKDAGFLTKWDTLSWVPTYPTQRALPNNKLNEQPTFSKGIDMTGNLLLYHFDETALGTCVGGRDICDFSGTGNNATRYAATINTVGLFGRAPDFAANNTYFAPPAAPNIASTTSFTYSTWVKLDTATVGAITNRNGDYILDRNTTGTSIIGIKEFTGNRYAFQIRYESSGTWFGPSGGTIKIGVWQNITIVRDYKQFFRLYVDGINVASVADSGLGIITPIPKIGARGSPAVAGSSIDGKIDDFAVWNRALSATEISNIYKRGVGRLRFQVRSCDDALCAGEPFIGPDGTAGTSYTDISYAGTGVPSFTLTNVLNNRYFQYQTFLETYSTTTSSELISANINFTKLGGTGKTAESCIDLTNYLTPAYFTSLPVDPSLGSLEKTYYAIKQLPNGITTISSCAPENEMVIKASR